MKLEILMISDELENVLLSLCMFSDQRATWRLLIFVFHEQRKIKEFILLERSLCVVLQTHCCTGVWISLPLLLFQWWNMKIYLIWKPSFWLFSVVCKSVYFSCDLNPMWHTATETHKLWLFLSQTIHLNYHECLQSLLLTAQKNVFKTKLGLDQVAKPVYVHV